LPGLSEASSIIGGRFAFTGGSTWAELKPSYLIGRDVDGLFAIFLQYGPTTCMNGLSFWEGGLQEGRLGYFEYAVTGPTLYQGVYYPEPLLAFASLDFFFDTITAPAAGGEELIIERLPVRLRYAFSIGRSWTENPLDWFTFMDFGSVLGSARGFAKLRFFGEFVDDGVRRYRLYDMREVSIDLVQTPEPASCVLAGTGLLLIWLGGRFRRRSP
jgi:hypothetical protein